MKIVDDFLIPATYGKAFVVKKGRVLRIIEEEGKQVADATFFNADNFRENFHSGMSLVYSMWEGTGNFKRLGKLYSRPPYNNVMLTVIDDPVGVHFAWMGGRCTSKIYGEESGAHPGKRHRTCQDNISEAIRPWGLEAHDVPDVYNIFMNVDDRAAAERGELIFLPPASKKGDYIDLKAEINILAAISACPDERGAVNEGVPKPLRIQILE